jgi:hypothetical protein
MKNTVTAAMGVMVEVGGTADPSTSAGMTMLSGISW